MRVFLCYSSEDRNLVEPISLALRAQGHRVFFDRSDLPPGEEYDMRIRRAMEKSQLFIFMLSPTSLDAGSYTLTELGIAQATWEHPGGRLLPVVLRPMGLDQVPAYLKAITFLEPEECGGQRGRRSPSHCSGATARAPENSGRRSGSREHRLRRSLCLLEEPGGAARHRGQRRSACGDGSRRQFYDGRR